MDPFKKRYLRTWGDLSLEEKDEWKRKHGDLISSNPKTPYNKLYENNLFRETFGGLPEYDQLKSLDFNNRRALLERDARDKAFKERFGDSQEYEDYKNKPALVRDYLLSKQNTYDALYYKYGDDPNLGTILSLEESSLKDLYESNYRGQKRRSELEKQIDKGNLTEVYEGHPWQNVWDVVKGIPALIIGGVETAIQMSKSGSPWYLKTSEFQIRLLQRLYNNEKDFAKLFINSDDEEILKTIKEKDHELKELKVASRTFAWNNEIKRFLELSDNKEEALDSLLDDAFAPSTAKAVAINGDTITYDLPGVPFYETYKEKESFGDKLAGAGLAVAGRALAGAAIGGTVGGVEGAALGSAIGAGTSEITTAISLLTGHPYLGDMSMEKKIDLLAKYKAISEAYGEEEALYGANINIKNFIEDEQNIFNRIENNDRQIFIGGTANIMNKYFMVKGALESADGNTNYLKGLDENGEELPWYNNPVYWQNAEHLNTFDPEVMEKSKKVGGISRYQNLYEDDDLWNFNRIFDEAYRMQKFFWSDYYFGRFLGLAGKGTLRTLGAAKFTNGAGLMAKWWQSEAVLSLNANIAQKAALRIEGFTTPILMNSSISHAYAMNTFNDTYQTLEGNAYEYADLKAEEQAMTYLEQPEIQGQLKLKAAQAYKEALAEYGVYAPTETECYKEVYATELQKLKRAFVENIQNNDPEYLKRIDAAGTAALSAYLTNAAIEELAMYANTMYTSRKLLLSKNTRAGLGVGQSDLNLAIRNGKVVAVGDKANFSRVLLRNIIGGGETNFHDDFRVDIAKGLGFAEYNDLISDNYDSSNVENSASYFSNFLAGLNYAGTHYLDLQHLLDGVIGALGSVTNISPNMSSIVNKFNNRNQQLTAEERKEKEKFEQQRNLLEKISDWVANPILAEYTELRAQDRAVEELAQALDIAFLNNKEILLNTANSLFRILNYKMAHDTSGNLTQTQDSEDLLAYLFVTTVDMMSKHPLFLNSPELLQAVQSIEKLANDDELSLEESSSLITQYMAEHPSEASTYNKAIPEVLQQKAEQIINDIRDNAKKIKTFQDRYAEAVKVLAKKYKDTPVSNEVLNNLIFNQVMRLQYADRLGEAESRIRLQEVDVENPDFSEVNYASYTPRALNALLEALNKRKEAIEKERLDLLDKTNDIRDLLKKLRTPFPNQETKEKIKKLKAQSQSLALQRASLNRELQHITALLEKINEDTSSSETSTSFHTNKTALKKAKVNLKKYAKDNPALKDLRNITVTDVSWYSNHVYDYEDPEGFNLEATVYFKVKGSVGEHAIHLDREDTEKIMASPLSPIKNEAHLSEEEIIRMEPELRLQLFNAYLSLKRQLAQGVKEEDLESLFTPGDTKLILLTFDKLAETLPNILDELVESLAMQERINSTDLLITNIDNNIDLANVYEEAVRNSTMSHYSDMLRSYNVRLLILGVRQKVARDYKDLEYLLKLNKEEELLYNFFREQGTSQLLEDYIYTIRHSDNLGRAITIGGSESTSEYNSNFLSDLEYKLLPILKQKENIADLINKEVARASIASLIEEFQKIENPSEEQRTLHVNALQTALEESKAKAEILNKAVALMILDAESVDDITRILTEQTTNDALSNDVKDILTNVLDLMEVAEKLSGSTNIRDIRKETEEKIRTEQEAKKELERKKYEEEQSKIGTNFGWSGFIAGQKVFVVPDGGGTAQEGTLLSFKDNTKAVIELKEGENAGNVLTLDSSIQADKGRLFASAGLAQRLYFDGSTTEETTGGEEASGETAPGEAPATDEAPATTPPPTVEPAPADDTDEVHFDDKGRPISKNNDFPEPPEVDNTNEDIEQEPSLHTGTLLGNPFVRYEWETLVDQGKLVKKEPQLVGDTMHAFYSWLDNTNTDLQKIIDTEVHNIIAEEPETKVHIMGIRPKNINDNIEKVDVLVMPYNEVAKKYHDESNGGVIVSQGKEYLVIGELGYSSKDAVQKKAYFEQKDAFREKKNAFFINNAAENYFVDTDSYTEIRSMTGGAKVKAINDEDTATPLRSILDLINGGKERNPYHMELSSLVWGIYKGDGIHMIGRHGEVKSPRNALPGRVYLYLPTADGTMIPTYVRPANFADIDPNSELYRKITTLLGRCTNKDINVRREAVTKLLLYLHMENEGRSILVGTEDINTVTITGENNIIIGTHNVSSPLFNFINFLEDVKRAKFKINVTPTTLTDESTLELYMNSGALLTDLAALYTANSVYDVYDMVDGKPNKASSTVTNYVSRDFTSKKEVVYYKGDSYTKDTTKSTWTHDKTGNEVTEKELFYQLEWNSRINEGEHPTVGSQGEFDFYQFGSTIVKRNRNTYEVVMLNALLSAAYIARTKALEEQNARARNAAEAVAKSGEETAEEGEVTVTSLQVDLSFEGTPLETEAVVEENLHMTPPEIPAPEQGHLVSSEDVNLFGEEIKQTGEEITLESGETINPELPSNKQKTVEVLDISQIDVKNLGLPLETSDNFSNFADQILSKVSLLLKVRKAFSAKLNRPINDKTELRNLIISKLNERASALPANISIELVVEELIKC